MKNLIILSSILIVWGGCQTSPKSVQLPFETFQVQKITEKGIQVVEISATQEAWPEVQYKELKPNSYNAKNIKIAVLGDTGCRLKESKSGARYQDCNQPSEWPYPQITKTIAAETYDFAIHTGDYHYREKCSDPKLCPMYTKSIGYGWDAWWDDFYGPSQPLFKRSPLLLVRGNHEECARAYSGWGPLSPIDKKFKDQCDEIEPYQWIEMDDLVLINFDDSSFEDRKTLKPEDRAKWAAIFKKMDEHILALKGKKEIWLITHRPVLGFFPSPEDAEPLAIVDNLKSVMTEAGATHFDYYLSGHVHNQQVITTEKNAIQAIVGHTGTGLDPFGRKIMNQQMVTTSETARSFGYGIFERTGFKKWNWIFKDQNGAVVLNCKINAAKAKCDFVN
ncbi:MAG: metallophosphoesterase [Bdellovibrio sp.]|nr:metallophosphoesterase [Bdellovibrio sp.]